nr:isochorismatase family protein [Dermatophilus congolensis]
MPKIARYSYDSRTALALNGTNWKVAPERAVLLIHDMQRHYIDAFEPGGQASIATARIIDLLDIAREHEIPVIYTAQDPYANDDEDTTDEATAPTDEADTADVEQEDVEQEDVEQEDVEQEDVEQEDVEQAETGDEEPSTAENTDDQDAADQPAPESEAAEEHITDAGSSNEEETSEEELDNIGPVLGASHDETPPATDNGEEETHPEDPEEPHDDDLDGADILDHLAPEENDTVLTKWQYSDFHDSELRERMRQEGRDQLIITGIYAHVNCLATALVASAEKLQPFFVADAMADHSREEHEMAARSVASSCGQVVTTADILHALMPQLDEEENTTTNHEVIGSVLSETKPLSELFADLDAAASLAPDPEPIAAPVIETEDAKVIPFTAAPEPAPQA